MGHFDQVAAGRAAAPALVTADNGTGLRAAELLPLVYDLLRRRARRLIARERGGHGLSATGLVHEAYLRLADRDHGFESRRHFCNAAAQAMRRVLVDRARWRGRLKRGGDATVSLDLSAANHGPACGGAAPLDWLALDEALEALARSDARRHRVVMLRFFAGLEVAKVAELLGVDERTVRRDWVMARLWLHARLADRDE